MPRLLSKSMGSGFFESFTYPFQFEFQQKYTTSFALIYLTETIKEALDQGEYGFVFLLICKKPLTLLIT